MHPHPEIRADLRHEAHSRDERSQSLRLPLGRGIGHEPVARRQRAELLDPILQEAARQAARPPPARSGGQSRVFTSPRHRHLRHGGDGDPAGDSSPRPPGWIAGGALGGAARPTGPPDVA